VAGNLDNMAYDWRAFKVLILSGKKGRLPGKIKKN
jgi:hypothetical protein